MKNVTLRVSAVWLGVWMVLCPMLLLAKPFSSAPRGAAAAQDQNFDEEELDELLAPVALYPDPLLAQLLPASTFVDQLDEASRVLGGRSDDNLIADRDWDISVKSVAHYPQILQRMVQKRDWTTALGQAYVNQSTDVLKSVQRLRAEARAAGSLVTTPQQTVVIEGQVIKVVPAQPQVIYVPQYNPEVVYVKEESSGVSTGTAVAAAAISFGVGMAIGAWLNNDCNWNSYSVFYHGWSGGGWVGVNRTFVNVNRNVYVNRRYTNVNVNRSVVNRNISSYRGTLRRDADFRRERIGGNDLNRDRVNNARRDAVNRNGDLRQRTRNNDSRNDALRSRDVDRERLDAARGRETREQPAAGTRDSSRLGAGGAGTQRPAASGGQSIFSGGGNGAEARAQRDRGASSRAQMQTPGSGNRGGEKRGGLFNRGQSNGDGARSRVGNRGGGLGGRRRN
jgi:hypothetical protein